jgi:hypothetical protein
MAERFVAWFDGTMKPVKARDINPRWFAHREGTISGWTLSHRLTGYAAGKGLSKFKDAVALAAALEKAYAPKRWEFTDAKKAKGFKKARAIVVAHGGI